MKVYEELQQGTPEWLKLRSGMLTGSVAGHILATIKTGGEPAARRDLRLRLACERLTLTPQDDTFMNADMQRGIDLEPAARAAYESATGSMVRQTGFIAHDTLLAGCSLDGDVNDCEGIIEIKAPKAAIQVRYWRDGAVPREYLPQLRHNAWISNAAWADFVAYCPLLPEKLSLFIVRLTRDQLDIPGYETEAIRFLDEVTAEVAALEELRGRT